MKKIGFTLMEVLVAIAIVAIIGTLIAPKLASIMPNSDKIKVLKYHAALEQTITELLTTEGIYYSVDVPPDGVPDCEGLNCTGRPLVPPFIEDRFSGINKFANLVSFKLGIENDHYIDGSRWVFEIGNRAVIITPNGELGGCTYEENICLEPTAFSFVIDDEGNVFGEDALTRAYLETPERTNNKALDFARAREIYATIE